MKTYREFRPTGFDTAGLSLPDRQDWLVAPVGTNRDADLLTESEPRSGLCPGPCHGVRLMARIGYQTVIQAIRDDEDADTVEAMIADEKANLTDAQMADLRVKLAERDISRGDTPWEWSCRELTEHEVAELTPEDES